MDPDSVFLMWVSSSQAPFVEGAKEDGRRQKWPESNWGFRGGLFFQEITDRA